MTLRFINRAANQLDKLIAAIHDWVSGNKARRVALHRRVSAIADDIRRQKMDEKRAIANRRLGRIPQGHRLMLTLRALHYRSAV
ncbi:hypothetical protein SAMN05880558_112136 [Aeromonas sp. RU39B]|uniref:hypothetical protein n=1 Tax=Aeromonas sp. RU39B TaxID=1907416 RepID=UPI0009542D34|nr:hypothetical protein [Aeromonas sp. RU39B]SIR37704.1 hypothetical protein SAMN05880558_112136 [Aeromonas sp. RU39B]